MKNNNKNRKLRYIRTKNALRHRDASLISCFKVSDQLQLNDPFIQETISDIINSMKIYKLPLKHKVSIGHLGKDFIMNLTTVRIETTRE